MSASSPAVNAALRRRRSVRCHPVTGVCTSEYADEYLHTVGAQVQRVHDEQMPTLNAAAMRITECISDRLTAEEQVEPGERVGNHHRHHGELPGQLMAYRNDP